MGSWVNKIIDYYACVTIEPAFQEMYNFPFKTFSDRNFYSVLTQKIPRGMIMMEKHLHPYQKILSL